MCILTLMSQLEGLQFKTAAAGLSWGRHLYFDPVPLAARAVLVPAGTTAAGQSLLPLYPNSKKKKKP